MSSPAPSQPWQSPMASPPPPTPLISPEIRRAMHTWANRPFLLNPRPAAPPANDSSSASLPQELIVDEVKRQVQLALQVRDKDWKS